MRPLGALALRSLVPILETAATAALGAIAIDRTVEWVLSQVDKGGRTSPTTRNVIGVAVSLGAGAVVGKLTRSAAIGSSIAIGGAVLNLYQLAESMLAGALPRTSGLVAFPERALALEGLVPFPSAGRGFQLNAMANPMMQPI